MTKYAPIWTPSPERIQQTNLHHFTIFAENRSGRDFPTYEALHRWSIQQPEEFWIALRDFLDLPAPISGDIAVTQLDKMPGAQWFPNTTLNFSENILMIDFSEFLDSYLSFNDPFLRISFLMFVAEIL